VGKALYATLLHLLKAQGAKNALAGITLPNPRSVAFHESFGFRPVGVYHTVGYKLNRWHDVGWWELRLDPSPAPPGEVVQRIGKIAGTGSWERAVQAGLRQLKHPG